ncbi:sensor histidine kinase [Falsiroseomonas sp.]|uniref:sensor histidine kinase n=1 Tax=Falsiroseomonas sp. TaxID=2870721 RepID=UPI00356332F4
MRRQSTSPPVWDAARLRIAADAAGIALWSWNVDTDEIALDERAHRMWGVPANNGLGTFEDLSARIHPEDLDRVRAAFTATREIMGAYELDFRILHDGEVRWVSARGRGEDQGIVGRTMFGIFIDVSERKLAEEAREMLAGEMSHRVKNLFAIACALTRIVARSATTTTEMASDLVSRLTALGQAHELVRPALSKQRKAIELGALLGVLLDAYDDKGAIGDRIRIAVPAVLVGEGSVTTLALVVHELATNSLKYGALSNASGTLDVSCTADDAEVVIVWTEKGGPPVAVAEGQAGFGSRLVNRSITSQLGGSIAFAWPREGVTVTLRMSRARLGA